MRANVKLVGGFLHQPFDRVRVAEAVEGDGAPVAGERVPDSEALVVRSQNFRATYRELWELTGRAARGLLALGVEKGDRVGIWSPNRYEWVVTQFATARVGAILVNVNPAYRTVDL